MKEDRLVTGQLLSEERSAKEDYKAKYEQAVKNAKDTEELR